MIIVTGVSSGLGKAIAEAYLVAGERVIGIGRRNTIQHPYFTFHYCDLSDLDQIDELRMEWPVGPVTLINNAGIIGNIQRISDQRDPDIDEVLTVNVSAPVKLTHKVYNLIADKQTFTLVNISSGAARKAIPSWASYCASKAALNMFSEVFAIEEAEKGNHPRVLCVAPGVVDTPMQEQIRTVSTEQFSAVENFRNLKENNELFSAEEAAHRLITLIGDVNKNEVFYDLRDVQLTQ